ncbi:YciI family protein [Tautonia sociabilis]|uniref:YciI family protein n=1 Tax=Tautonia sociabilis TaxID=2080755 RepID=A0A432MIB6_9BACT|nr:YciI family protein [Tautonia sociabilis]RUL87101.1 YciI family protein [Tautonia sociabilis]
MKVMALVKATESSEAGEMPDETLLEAMTRYNEDLAKAGVLIAGEGLHPSSKGVRVRFSDEGRRVVSGPFTETNALIAGFWLWRVESMDEAIDWARRCPNPSPGGPEVEIELRPVFGPEDFSAADPSGAIRAAEDRIRAGLVEGA